MLTAKAEMLIRRPVGQVFEAFVDPGVTSKFWFSGGSGRLEVGKTVPGWQPAGVAGGRRRSFGPPATIFRKRT